MTRPKRHQAFGDTLQRARGGRGWTQEKLAEVSHIPLTMIQAYEQGRALPSAMRLAALCDVLRVKAEVLLPRPWNGGAE